MTDYTISSVSEIRDFLWDGIKTEGILRASDYQAPGIKKALVPIIPTQQVPEFNNMLPGKTYIVYDFKSEGYGEEYWICQESITFYIISKDYGKIVELTSYIVDLFRRMDDTAKELNGSSLVSDKFKYYYFSLSSVESPLPFEEEGGVQVGSVSITYNYSRLMGQNGRFL